MGFDDGSNALDKRRDPNGCIDRPHLPITGRTEFAPRRNSVDARMIKSRMHRLFSTELFPLFGLFAGMLFGLYALVVLVWILSAPGTALLEVFPNLRLRESGQVWGLLFGFAISVATLVLIFMLIDWLVRSIWAEEFGNDRARESQAALAVRAPMMARLGAVLLLALLFNFAPWLIGPTAVSEGGMRVLTLLAPGFQVHVPLLNSWFTGVFILYLVLLIRGEWNRAARWAHLALGVLGVVILYRILRGGSFSHIDQLLKPICAVGLLGLLAVSLLRLYRLVRRPAAQS